MKPASTNLEGCLKDVRDVGKKYVPHQYSEKGHPYSTLRVHTLPFPTQFSSIELECKFFHSTLLAIKAIEFALHASDGLQRPATNLDLPPSHNNGLCDCL